MAGPFGVLPGLELLQNCASALIAGLNPAVVHNLAKYMALKKVHYLSAMEDVDGETIASSGSSPAVRSAIPSVAAEDSRG